MLADETADWLRDVCSDHPAVRTAVVFGSVAPGTERPDSDLDDGLVVNPERWEPLDKVDLLGGCVQAGVERIDLVVLNDAPLVVQFEAVRSNVLLYGADDFSPGTFVSKVVRRDWGFKPYLDRQRKAYKRRLTNEADG